MSVGVKQKFYVNTDSGTWWKYNQWRTKYFNRYKLLPNTRNTWDLEIFLPWSQGLIECSSYQLDASLSHEVSSVSDLMSSCSWFVLTRVSSLITDWPLTFTSPLSLLYLDSGQLNMMNCYGSLIFSFIGQPGPGSFNFIISGSQQITSESLILLPQITNEIWEGARVGPGPCNQ